MNLRDLQYFTAVAESGHFGRAAEKCFVTQPTLSGQLRKLEDILGHPLFERTTRAVKLTSFGREVLVIARRILADCERITRKAQEMNDPFIGPLTLGAFPTIGPWLLPRLTPILKSVFPDTSFYLIEEKSPVLQQQLETEQIDAAILSLPQSAEAIHSIPLFHEPFLAAVPEDHKWSDRLSVDPEELAGEHLLLLEDGHCLRDQALDICRLQEHARPEDFRATSLETLRQMVRLGAGITLIPQLAVPSTPEPGIRYIPVSGANARRDIALCFRTTHPRRRFLQELAESIMHICCTDLGVDKVSASKISAPGELHIDRPGDQDPDIR
ncbi:MAG: LysR substrate-binding domain-containing protein [Spirochaeta sp.]